ncbi:hypothetical protein [Vibrio coralliirubri]|uniref:hypothetical protein n=1 Tax=Vibrio coralliirubri TaxID=1516159 RepID=UPI0021C3DA8C|nr:hypothetical protein [Vibrio coralliirubri]
MRQIVIDAAKTDEKIDKSVSYKVKGGDALSSIYIAHPKAALLRNSMELNQEPTI